jgi:hypothetical protein
VPGRLAERVSRCGRLPRCCTGQRRFMDARVESDIRQNLEWAAVDHHDAETPNALVVVVVRGSIARDATCCLAECMPRIGCACRRQAEIANDRFTMLDMTLRSRRWGNELSFVSACCRMHMTLSAATARYRCRWQQRVRRRVRHNREAEGLFGVQTPKPESKVWMATAVVNTRPYLLGTWKTTRLAALAHELALLYYAGETAKNCGNGSPAACRRLEAPGRDRAERCAGKRLVALNHTGQAHAAVRVDGQCQDHDRISSRPVRVRTTAGDERRGGTIDGSTARVVGSDAGGAAASG